MGSTYSERDQKGFLDRFSLLHDLPYFCALINQKSLLAMKANSVTVAAICMALRALTASCAVTGSHLMSLTKPRALQMRHKPVSAFIGLNRLSKDIEEPYKSNFYTLTSNVSTITRYFPFITLFLGAFSAAAVSDTLFKISQTYRLGPAWVGGAGAGIIVTMTSPFWTEFFRKPDASSSPGQQKTLSSQAFPRAADTHCFPSGR